MAGACGVQSHSNVRHRTKFEAGKYFRMPRDNIEHCFPVGEVLLFDSHRNAIVLSNCTVDLNTCNTTRDLEGVGSREEIAEKARMAQTPFHPDKRDKVDFYMMALEIINLKEVVKDEL